MLGKIPHEFPFPDYGDEKTKIDILHTCIKMNQYFREHDNILISVSGGSDSDCIVHLVCKYFPEYISKCKFVFVDTGLEYEATKRHLHDIEKRYGITIEKIRGKSVVTVVREYGIPILSKTRSEDIYYYQKGAQWAINRIDNNIQGGRYGYPDNFRDMIHYATEHGIKISPRCCTYSKKQPIKEYMRKHKIELNVTGERKAEGGQRASNHKTCFEAHKDGMHKYMPLWWWTNETKAAFKKAENIKHSACYEIWGMKRTGCVGCPFSLDIASNLDLMQKYEPNLFRVCMRVFGKSYILTDRFNCKRKKCLSFGLIKKAEKMGVLCDV